MARPLCLEQALPAGEHDIGAFQQASLALDATHPVYVHLVRGELSVNGTRLAAGDAAKLQGETQLTLSNGKDAEVLVFDLTEH